MFAKKYFFVLFLFIFCFFVKSPTIYGNIIISDQNTDCNFKFDFLVSYDSNRELINIVVSDLDHKFKEIYVSVEEPNSAFGRGYSEHDKNSLEYSFSVEGNDDGNYTIKLKFKDYLDNVCFVEKSFLLDRTKPIINFVNKNTDINTNLFRISAEVFDKYSGVKDVKFFINNKYFKEELNPLQKEDSVYYYDLNLSKYAPGSYTVTVFAYDNQNNKAEASLSFSILDKKENIENAEFLAKVVEEKIIQLKKDLLIAKQYGMDVLSLEDFVRQSEELYSSSIKYIVTGQYRNAVLNLKKLLTDLNNLKDSFYVEYLSKPTPILSDKSLFSKNLKSYLNEKQIAEAESFFDKYLPERFFYFAAVKLNNNINYITVFEIRVKKHVVENVYGYEYIPKEIINRLGKPKEKPITEDPFIVPLQFIYEDSNYFYAFYVLNYPTEQDLTVLGNLQERFIVPPIIYDDNSTYLKNLDFFNISTYIAPTLFTIFVVGIILFIYYYNVKREITQKRKEKYTQKRKEK
ncbi:MAG: Ig-like domain-containing protein [Candidatus Diapherotrites archaeon]|nr:Ig-like domain-containing protein [Candidatus Diapherotrites archaeon]